MLPPPLPTRCPGCDGDLAYAPDDVPLDACYHCGEPLSAQGVGRPQSVPLGDDLPQRWIRLRRFSALALAGYGVMGVAVTSVISYEAYHLDWLPPVYEVYAIAVAGVAWLGVALLWLRHATAGVGQATAAADGVYLRRGGRTSFVAWESLAAFKVHSAGLDLLDANGKRLARLPRLADRERHQLTEEFLSRQVHDVSR